MSNPTIHTGGSARHAYISETVGTIVRVRYTSPAMWHGREVVVTSSVGLACPHVLHVVHHTDDEGRHYCPTGFLMCGLCGGIADEPGPPSCTRWGE